MKPHELELAHRWSIDIARQLKERTSTNVHQLIRTVQFTMVSTMMQDTSVVACNEWGVPRSTLVKKKYSRNLFQCAIIVVDRIVIVVEQLAQGFCVLLEFRSPNAAIGGVS